jgi:hypothetical protein
MIRGLGFLLLLLALALTLDRLHPLRFLKNELVRSGYHASSGALEAPTQEHPSYLQRRFQKINPALGSVGPPQHKDVIDAPSLIRPLSKDSAGDINQDLFKVLLDNPLSTDSAGNINQDLFKVVPDVIRP